jgi:hypothetical protein
MRPCPQSRAHTSHSAFGVRTQKPVRSKCRIYITSYDVKKMVKKISSAQMRAARALLRWTALDLANASRVGVATIRRAEVVDGEIPVTLANEAALRRALETAGIDFIEDDGGGEGVRFRKPRKAKKGIIRPSRSGP